MSQPLTNSTASLLRSIIEQLDEIAARGTFADADSEITDGLDAAQESAQAALDYLEADYRPIMRRDQWAPSLSMAQIGLVRRVA